MASFLDSILPDVEGTQKCNLKCISLIIPAAGIIYPAIYTPYYRVKRETYTDDIAIILSAVLLIIFFLASILLLIGVLIENKILCLIYEYYTLIFFVLMVIVVIVLIIRFVMQRKLWRTMYSIMSLVFCALLFFYAAVINSYRKSLS